MCYQKLFLFFVFTIHQCTGVKYSNFTLYRGIPVNDSHLRFFENLSNQYNVSFWRKPGLMNKPVDFMIGPEEKKSFLRTADANGLYLTTILEDVQEAFDKQTVKSYIRRRTESFDWRNYFKVKDIYDWLNDLSKIYPKEMKLWSIGKTYEDRDIMAVRVVLEGAKIRSKIVFEGGIHAREWASPAFVTYVLDQILHARHSGDKLLKKIALSHEWYFVPVVNPDGYEFTHTNDRLWRKNRHNGNHGVDVNRNFPIGFGTVGVSKNQRSEIYCGPSAFSEKESRALRDFILANGNDLEFYFGFHAYGQYMIIPYAHSKEHLENYDEVKLMTKEAAAKIAVKYKTQYTYGTAFDTVGYMTSGVSGCWVKKTLMVPYVVIFELRDLGRFGFALPPNEILPTCQETMDGVLSLILQGTSKSKLLITPLTGGQNIVLVNKIVICLLIIGLLYKQNILLI